MSTRISKAAYQRLIDEDLVWLLRQPRTLERNHIEQILRQSVESYYPTGKSNNSVVVISKTPDPSVVKCVICRNCGVKLQYVPNDVKRHDGKDYTGGADGRTWVDCPNCNKEAVLTRW